MKLEHYNIVTTSDTSFEGAKLKMREKVMDMCKQGWKLQGGASVTVKRYGKMFWYDIYQTVIPGKQRLEDYNIFMLSVESCEIFAKAVGQIEILLKDQCEKRAWKLQGGASVAAEFLEGKCDGPDYFIYQTVIK